jgi:hypothetical protein
MDRACSTNGEEELIYMILVGKPEGKRPLGKPRRRLVDNIVTDLINALPGNGSMYNFQRSTIEAVSQ